MSFSVRKYRYDRGVRRYGLAPQPLMIGIGYWLSGESVETASAGSNAESIGEKLERIQKSAELLSFTPGAHFVAVDDASPVKITDEEWADWTDPLPLTIVSLDENRGAGGKNHLLQALSVLGHFDYYFRLDADVELLDPIEPLFEAVESPGVCGATINCGPFTGRLCHRNPDRFPATRMIGNGLMIATKVFPTIGLFNPMLRRFCDMDWLFKAEFYGMKSVVSCDVRGVTKTSGSGCSLATIHKMADLLERENPLIKVCRHKDGKISLRHRKRKRGFAPQPVRRYRPADWAVQIAKEAWL